MPEGQQPRGVTPRPRSGAAAQSARLRRGRNGREELPHAPTPKARGSGWEDQPHVQGALATLAQEGLEELCHVECQEGQRCFARAAVKRYPTPKVRETKVRQYVFQECIRGQTH